MKNLFFPLFFFHLGIPALSQNVGIGIANPSEKLEILGNLRLTGSDKGIILNAADRPLITRGWDVFNSGNYAGLGRWGLFMDPNRIRIGMPDVAGKAFEVVTYQDNSTPGSSLLTVRQDGFVGIGVSNPAYILDVANRMRVKTGQLGNSFTTSGIWFEDYRDGANRIFFGMRDSIRVGFWGEGIPGAQWGFSFNARNGEVGVDGILKATTYQYNTPQTFYYAVSGADFGPVNSTDAFEIYANQGAISLFNGLNPLIAAVHLPHGALITSMLVSFYDMHASENLQVNLFVGDGVTVVGSVAQTISAGTPGYSLMLDNTIGHTVNNTNDAYYLAARSTTGTWTDNRLMINFIRITYTLPGPQ